MTELTQLVTRLYTGDDMAGRKYPSELNTRTIRVNIGDWQLLLEISRKAGVSVAEAFHLALQAEKGVTRVSPMQIPIPVFRVAPVTSVAVNGAGASHSAFKIKPKGGIIYE